MVAAGPGTGGTPGERLPRNPWRYALAALPPIVAAATTLVVPEPHGHWVDHLSGASLKFTQLAVLLTVLAWLRWRALPAPLVIALGAVGVAITIQVVGDVQVASAIWRTAGDPGFGGGYESGHDASGFGDLLVVLGGFGFVLIAAVSRRVRPWQAGCAAVLTVVPPPFLWPAAGVLFLMLHAAASGAGFARHRVGHDR